jgi:hypothetical protein
MGILEISVFTSLVLAWIILRIIKYERQINEKNMQIIQFYLDGKFLSKNLADSLRISDSSDFCASLINRIKEYYNLEDIIVIDSIKMLAGENNTLLRSEIVYYIQDNMATILNNLNDYDLSKFSTFSKGKRYEIYVSRIISKEQAGDGLIICVENAPTLLSKQERESLEISVNLLKNRIFYS